MEPTESIIFPQAVSIQFSHSKRKSYRNSIFMAQGIKQQFLADSIPLKYIFPFV